MSNLLKWSKVRRQIWSIFTVDGRSTASAPGVRKQNHQTRFWKPESGRSSGLSKPTWEHVELLLQNGCVKTGEGWLLGHYGIETFFAFPPWFCSSHMGRFWLLNCLNGLGNICLGRFDSPFEKWTIYLFLVWSMSNLRKRSRVRHPKPWYFTVDGRSTKMAMKSLKRFNMLTRF